MTDLHALRQLARLFGVQGAYYDVSRQRRTASAESLLLVLRQLGAPVDGITDAPHALRSETERIARLPVPVHVMWQGTPPVVRIRLPQNGFARLECHLGYEDGETRSWTLRSEDLRVLDDAETRVRAGRVVGLRIPAPVPFGYHRLALRAGKFACESRVFVAPRKVFRTEEKTWGVFVPPYALHSQNSWGAGSFSDLDHAAQWVLGLGGKVLATLPMLAAFLDEPFDPSPYAPASRLFWNEFYIDVTRAPELEGCREAREQLESGGVRSEIASLRAAREVDYRRLMALKRRFLELLARHFFATRSSRRETFEAYLGEYPGTADYARFRAVGERHGEPWPGWPERQRRGELRVGDCSPDAERYYLYAQWLAHEQVHELGRRTREAGGRLYLDLPLGVHPDGYDVWRHRDLFVTGLSIGAPPDTVFTHGQTWGFPPLHPGRLREHGYGHFIAVLRHHLRSAGMLRIDHVMGLHRLFCIPKGLDANDGVYVRYPADELYAILAIESHRHGAAIVGENLGTVPAYVDKGIARRGLAGMSVVQYALRPPPEKALPRVPPNAVASVNTHDMPPFAAFWRGLDIDQRKALGLLDDAGAAREKKQRQRIRAGAKDFLVAERWLEGGDGKTMGEILEAFLTFLSAGPARVVLVGLEDLWLETNPQNVPGTAGDLPNWRSKMRYAYERFSRMIRVTACLEKVDSLRKKGETVDV